MCCPPRERLDTALKSGLAQRLADKVAAAKAALPCVWAAFLCTGLATPPAAAQDEVPFITTPDHVTLAMLQMAGVTAQDFVLDLGSGDGRIVITAARRFGARGLGVEIVPELVQQSRANAQKAGVAERAQFLVQDLFATELSVASVVTMYLLPEVNLQLRPALLALVPGTRVVSHDWDLGDWRPDRSQTLDVPNKAVGREKSSTLHLWVVPARVQGLWCTASASLEVTQRFQTFSATLRERVSTAGAAGAAAASPSRAPLAVFDGTVNATQMTSALAAASPTTVLQAHAGALELRQASGAAARFQGQRFVAANAGRCP